MKNSDRGFLKGIRIGAFVKGFFGWFNPDNFMDTYQEWHALVEGFCEVLCPWPARYQPSRELLNDLKKDHHYYAFMLSAEPWVSSPGLSSPPSSRRSFSLKS